MKVLVAGGSGALARRVVEKLQRGRHEVAVVDRRPWPADASGIAFFEADIRKLAAADVIRRFHPDCVVHMATVNAIRAPNEDSSRTNLAGTRALYQFSAEHGVKHVVFVSRHTIYGASADAPLFHMEDEPPSGLERDAALADLTAADLYASQMLWREPKLKTTVLRVVYFLGESRTGTLARYLSDRVVPRVLGFDPAYQVIDEDDAAAAIALAVDAAAPGIFNVAGPAPLPLSVVIRESGREGLALPELALRFMRRRGSFSGLPQGGFTHLKYPIAVDGSAFRAATGFQFQRTLEDCLSRFRTASPKLL